MSPIFYIVLLFACTLTSSTDISRHNAEILAELRNYRLPKTVLPQSYSLRLSPSLQDREYKFQGEVYINITAMVSTKYLVMNTKNLVYTVKEYRESVERGTTFALNHCNVSSSTGKIIYTLPQNFTAGKNYTLHFKYYGSMDAAFGFYDISLGRNRNTKRLIAITQLWPSYARHVFPSFDEPCFKATFRITIVTPNNMTSFSNTNLIENFWKSNYYIDVYQQTPKISTYIVSIILSKLDKISANAEINIPEVSDTILQRMGTYLGQPYESIGIIDRSSLIISNSLSTEKWDRSIQIFKDFVLLYEDNLINLCYKNSTTTLKFYRKSHLWFGTLITCDWWSYLWLNEGFATYFSYMHFQYNAVAEINEMETEFVVNNLQDVMIMDAKRNTSPLNSEHIKTLQPLNRDFAIISYNKGAAFIRMMKYAMGEERFQRSIQEYLAYYKYETVVPANLLEFWEKHWPTNHKTQVPLVFKSFTDQSGYPLVTINVSLKTKRMFITQKRFIFKSEGELSDKEKLLYNIPFTYTTNVDRDFVTTQPRLYLAATKNYTTVNLPEKVEWVIANIQQTGYYRVNYDERNWQNIQRALLSDNFGGIHELNRAQMISDLFQLAYSGEIDIVHVFERLEYLQTEVAYAPWLAAFNGFNALANLLDKSINFGEYIRNLTARVYRNVGFEEKPTDTKLDVYHRANVLKWACEYGNPECISKAKDYFWNMTDNPVPVNLRLIVYCTVIREGYSYHFQAVLNKYLMEPLKTEKDFLLPALGCTKEAFIVKQLFQTIIDGVNIDRMDALTVLKSLYTNNRENVSLVFGLIMQHYKELVRLFGGYRAIALLIADIAKRLNTPVQLRELQEFNSKNVDEFYSLASLLKEAETAVAYNIKWLSQNM